MKKAYRYKDEDMLIAALTLCTYFEDHKPKLTALRGDWKDPFIDQFKQRIHDALQNYVGKATNKDLRIATLEMVEMQRTIHFKLSLFKTQVETALKADTSQAGWVLSTFGFDDYWAGVQKRDQEKTIALLYRIKQNLKGDIKTTLEDASVPLTLARELAAQAEVMEQAEVKQETLKTEVLELTEQGRKEFNTIYKTAIDICTIGYQLFRTQKTTRRKFSFSKLVSHLHTTGSSPNNK